MPEFGKFVRSSSGDAPRVSFLFTLEHSVGFGSLFRGIFKRFHGISLESLEIPTEQLLGVNVKWRKMYLWSRPTDRCHLGMPSGISPNTCLEFLSVMLYDFAWSSFACQWEIFVWIPKKVANSAYLCRNSFCDFLGNTFWKLKRGIYPPKMPSEIYQAVPPEAFLDVFLRFYQDFYFLRWIKEFLVAILPEIFLRLRTEENPWCFWNSSSIFSISIFYIPLKASVGFLPDSIQNFTAFPTGNSSYVS